MATRGHLGGLALATPQAIRVLDAARRPWVLIETVGVGQVEVEVASSTDTVVVVVNPGWGDSVQANKAGLMEIADLFVINKADRAGVGDTRRDLEQMLDLSSLDGWRPPILPTVASDGKGLVELWDAIGAHQDHLVTSGELERRRAERLDKELRRIVIEQLRARARAAFDDPAWDQLNADVLARRTDPWSAADEIVSRLDELAGS